MKAMSLSPQSKNLISEAECLPERKNQNPLSLKSKSYVLLKWLCA